MENQNDKARVEQPQPLPAGQGAPMTPGDLTRNLDTINRTYSEAAIAARVKALQNGGKRG
jgi:hypothetical protein